MRRLKRILLAAAFFAGSLLPLARADEETVATDNGMSEEDVEMLKEMELLENLELAENLETVQYMPLIDEEEKK
jgi:hypothetical protein